MFGTDEVWDAVFISNSMMASSSWDDVTIWALNHMVTKVKTIQLNEFPPHSLKTSGTSLLIFGNGQHNQLWNSSTYQWIANEPFGSVDQAEFSANGDFLVLATGNKLHIHIFKGSSTHELDTDNDPLRPLRILPSPDCSMIAAIYDSYVRLWHLDSGIDNIQSYKILIGDADRVQSESITFSPNSRHLLLSTALYGNLILLNCQRKTPQSLRQLKHTLPDALAWHPDGRFVAAGVGSDVVFIDMQEYLTV